MVQDLLLITNFLNFVKIDKLVVPDVVEISSDVILDCQYTVPDANFTLQWIFNNNSLAPAYVWSPYSEPKISGILDGRLDLTYRVSRKVFDERRALRIISLTPELSGNYTCVILNHDSEARQTKAMLVYSVQHDFELTTDCQRGSNVIELSCIARGVYPQPDLTIEYNNVMVSGQHQRVWRTGGGLYDAVCFARIAAQSATKAVVACRLCLPQADYTAIKKRVLYNGIPNAITSSWKLVLLSFAISLRIK